MVHVQGGQPLGNAEETPALHALGDLKLGLRHVRNLCAIIANKLEAASEQQAHHCFLFFGALPNARATST